MKRSLPILLGCLLISSMAQATNPGSSVVEIPKGAVFSLNRELRVPANRNFITLGQNRLEQSFNEFNQYYNVENGRSTFVSGTQRYEAYLDLWQNTAEESYQRCLERHRRIFPRNDWYTNSNTIINRGNGNTNIIVNKGADYYRGYSNYIEDNTCIRPDYTVSMLLLNGRAADSGGKFRRNHQFTVSKVSHRRRGRFHEITIWFDHDIARGIRILTSHHPRDIRISQLDGKVNRSGGFWSGVGAALTQSVDIGGNYFSISLPEVGYFE